MSIELSNLYKCNTFFRKNCKAYFHVKSLVPVPYLFNIAFNIFFVQHGNSLHNFE